MYRSSLDKLEKEILKLTPNDQSKLLEKLKSRTRPKQKGNGNVGWVELKNAAKDLWHIDAQKYIDGLRENRL